MPPTVWLLLYLPLVKLVLPVGAGTAEAALRFAVFYGGGVALSAWLLRREAGWSRLRPLLARPWRGAALGVLGYALLAGTATLLLYGAGAWLPGPGRALLGLFDLRPLWEALGRSAPLPGGGRVALFAGGAVAEEWIFRCVLFWRWAVPGPATPRAGWRALRERPAGTSGRLLAVSLYFAALHWPQPPGALLVALLGSLALGGVLLLRPDFALIATLHALFNLKVLLP